MLFVAGSTLVILATLLYSQPPRDKAAAEQEVVTSPKLPSGMAGSPTTRRRLVALKV